MLGDDRGLWDFWGKATSGPKAGQYVGQNIFDGLYNDPKTARFGRMWVDYALCNPYRTTFLCGQTRLHHDNENDENGHYKKWMRGDYESNALYGRPNQYNGPLFQDLACQYAHAHSETYDQYYLPQSHWPVVNRDSVGSRKGTAWGPGTLFNSGMNGQTITGPGIPAGTTFTYIDQTHGTLSVPATASKQGTVIIGGTICCGTKVTSGSTAISSFCGTAGIHSGTIASLGLGGTTDHLQAYTGSLLTWLRIAGVHRVAIFGKLANCYGASTTIDVFSDTAQLNGAGHGQITDEFIPAGVTDACIVTGDAGATGDIQDHWHVSVVEYHATDLVNDNPPWGRGVTGTRKVFRYNHCIDNIAWDATNSQLVVTISNDPSLETIAPSGGTKPCDGDCNFSADELEIIEVGEEIAITGCSQAAYNNPQWIIDSINATTVRISKDAYNNPATNHGTVTGGAGVQCSPRSLFSDWVFAKKALAFYKTVKDYESYFCYIPSRMCHGQVAGVGTGGCSDQNDITNIGFEEEIRYLNTVDGTGQADTFYGVPNSVNPAIDAADLPLTDNTLGIWERRREMDCTFDDIFKFLVTDYLDVRWGKYGHDIGVSSDNGWQQRAQGAAEPGGDTGARIGAKGFNYADSLLCPVWWRSRWWEMTGDIPIVCTIADMAPSILRLFSRKFPKLKFHHLAITGDGEALQDRIHAYIYAPDGPIMNQCFLTIGQWHNGSNGVQGGTNNAHTGAIIEKDSYRYIESILDPNDVALWDLNEVPIADMQWSSASGGTCTVTCRTAHGRTTGDRVWLVCTPDTWNVLGAKGDTGYNTAQAITVVNSNVFTVPMPVDPRSAGAFNSGIMTSRWEMENLATAQAARKTRMAARLVAAKAAGFDVSTRRSALVTTGSGSPSLDVDGNAAPAGNGNTTRTV